jgi:hypothetical protein
VFEGDVTTFVGRNVTHDIGFVVLCAVKFTVKMWTGTVSS